MTCTCYSNSADHGPTPNRLLAVPPHMTHVADGISIDACIADTVQHLWDNGVATESSCCSHNGYYNTVITEGDVGSNPHLLLGQHEDPQRVMTLIRENDDRDWKLFQWKLTDVTP